MEQSQSQICPSHAWSVTWLFYATGSRTGAITHYMVTMYYKNHIATIHYCLKDLKLPSVCPDSDCILNSTETLKDLLTLIQQILYVIWSLIQELYRGYNMKLYKPRCILNINEYLFQSYCYYLHYQLVLLVAEIVYMWIVFVIPMIASTG